jgi:hypothetical protein
VLHHGAVRRLVTARETDIGALINAGSGSGVELFKVADLHQMRVYVRVLQAYASQLRHGTAPRTARTLGEPPGSCLGESQQSS